MNIFQNKYDYKKCYSEINVKFYCIKNNTRFYANIMAFFSILGPFCIS